MAKYLKGLVCSCSSDMLKILAEQELQFINQNWSKISFCAAKFQKLVMESTTRFIDSHPPPLPHTHTHQYSVAVKIFNLFYQNDPWVRSHSTFLLLQNTLKVKPHYIIKTYSSHFRHSGLVSRPCRLVNFDFQPRCTTTRQRFAYIRKSDEWDKCYHLLRVETNRKD